MPLGSKAFEVLACLVAHAGDVVSKDVLLKTVWPNSFVEENNLSQHIFTLRKALGDRADYIVTVPGRGYQFTGRVLEIVPAIPKPSAPESAAAVEVETVPAVVPEETRLRLRRRSMRSLNWVLRRWCRWWCRSQRRRAGRV